MADGADVAAPQRLDEGAASSSTGLGSGSAHPDRSGAVAWAAECNAKGEMRSWIDLDPAIGGCAGMLWTASLILLRHLEVTQPGAWRGRRVLECGSGTGHLAVGLARLGAHVVATESAESHNGAEASGYVTMTSWTSKLLREWPGGGQPLDGAICTSSAEANAEAVPLSAGDGSEGGTVAFRRLHWGLDDLPPNNWDGFDVVILSELYFDPDLHEPLLQTLCRLLKPGMVAYSIFVDRPFSLGFLAMLDDDGSFEIKELAPEQTFGMQEDDIIYTHEITRHTAAE